MKISISKKIRRAGKMMLMLALLTTMFHAWPAGQASASDEYDTLRERWEEILNGGTSYNPLDPDIAARIAAITATAQSHWDTMAAAPSSYLWSDLASTSNAAHITSSYNRLKAMALAYSTKGSALENDAALLAAIKLGLDWMNVNRYNTTVAKYGNWWDWDIGTPLALNDTVVLLYHELSTAQITAYMAAIERFSPNPNFERGTYVSVGANRAWLCAIVAVRGVIVKDSGKIALARDAMSPLFDYVTSGDGFYRDGSFVQHSYYSYTGGYGKALLSDVGRLTQLLTGSTWAITDPDLQNVYQWMHETFEPVLYKGAMMDMTRGREIARVNSQDHASGHSVIYSAIRLAESASPADAAAFRSMAKYWINHDTYRSFFEYASMEMIVKGKAIVSDPLIPERPELIKYKQYPSMDRAVHLRPGFGFGLSMSSSRIANYESINNENMKGWYTGDGMTYLYNNDLEQYSDNFWPTVNPYRLPGTTVDTAARALRSGAGYRSAVNWAGGVSIDGQFGTSGMALNGYNSSLSARKSWFMFDDEIVALGARIRNSGQTGNGWDGTARRVETIVENRKLSGSGSNALTVNGTAKSSLTGWTETMTNVDWAHLEGNVAGSDIGYYFPGGAAINGQREARTGTWSGINTTFPNTTSHTRNYLSLWFDHGVNPIDAEYAYVLLPNKTSAEVEDYADHPNVTILHNTELVQAVKETTLNVVGANFWMDTPVWVQADGGNFLYTNRKASIMTMESAAGIKASVSDPTQIHTGSIAVEINRSAVAVVSADPGVTVTQLSPTIKFNVHVNGAKGKSFEIEFEYDAPEVLFEDDFEDGTASGWTAVSGSWSTTLDDTIVYAQTSASGEAITLAGDIGWTDYTVEAKMKIHTAKGNAGLMFRYADISNFYMFRLNDSNDHAELYKRVGGVMTLVDSAALGIVPGQWYDLKVVAEGNRIFGYVDDVMVVDWTNATTELTSGKIGFRMHTTAASFDNVRVAP